MKEEDDDKHVPGLHVTKASRDCDDTDSLCMTHRFFIFYFLFFCGMNFVERLLSNPKRFTVAIIALYSQLLNRPSAF